MESSNQTINAQLSSINGLLSNHISLNKIQELKQIKDKFEADLNESEQKRNDLQQKLDEYAQIQNQNEGIKRATEVSIF